MKDIGSIYVGVWVDMKKAVIVELVNGTEYRRTIQSGIEPHERFQGESSQASQFSGQFVDNERIKEHRLDQEVRDFLRSVTGSLTYSSPIVLFGPAEMKIKLKKELLDHSVLRDHIAGVETTDSMTENQMVAWVKQYYNLN